MAVLKSIVSGNWGTAGTWGVIDAPGTVTGVTGSTNITTANQYSNAWTESTGYTVSGVMLNVGSISGTTGTLTVGLFTGAGTSALASVTVNVADIQTTGWASFKFTSTFTLTASSTYRIGLVASNTAQIAFIYLTTTTNWNKYIITTNTSTLAAADTSFIAGDYTGAGTNTPITVTMDSTSNATAYGTVTIVQNGTLSYGIASSTNYYLKLSGNLVISVGGTFTMGTLANPIPSTSTAKLEFVCTSNGQFGIQNSGTLTTYGATKTITAKLAADISASATTATTNVSTGWSSGDLIVIAGTTQTATQAETTTLSGNASGTSISFSAVANAHGGNSTSGVQADIGNLTQNVQIFGQGSGTIPTFTSYIQMLSSNCTATMFYTSIYFCGTNSSTLGAISLQLGSSTINIQYCSIYGGTSGSGQGFNYLSCTGTSTVTFSNNVMHQMFVGLTQSYIAAVTSSNTTISNNMFIRSSYTINKANITFTNNTVTNSGVTGGGIIFNETSTSTYGTVGAISGNIAYGCGGYGIVFTGYLSGTISTSTAWRNINSGIAIQCASQSTLIIDTVTTFGNAISNLFANGSGNIWVKSYTSNGGTTLVSPAAISIGYCDRMIFNGASLGQTTAHSASDIIPAASGYFYPSNLIFYGTTFSSTPISSQSGLAPRISSYGVVSMNHNNNSNVHKSWQCFGTCDTDTNIYNTSNTSMRLTPTNANFKLSSYPVRLTMASGDTATIKANVRKSVVGDGTAYNGNAPRIVCLPNGPNTQTGLSVVATSVGAAGSWETLSGTFTATATGVFEFCVDCDGTTGWINVDDWYTTYYKQTTKLDYWFNGYPQLDMSSSVRETSSTFVD